VLGGSGFTQDWPIEQFVRDGRIARIYEGTNGIQAMDLVGRKLGLHKGRLVQSLFGDMTTYLKANPDCAHRDAFKGRTGHVGGGHQLAERQRPAGPRTGRRRRHPFLRLTAFTVMAYLWVRMADAAQAALDNGDGNRAFNEAKLVSAQFFFDKLLPEKDHLLADITDGKETLMALADEQWAL